MTSRLSGIEGHFAREVRSILLASPAARYRNVARELRELQKRYEGKLTGRRSQIMEIRRRIAETLFSESIVHRRPFSTSRAEFRKLEALGFTNTDLKAHYHLVYARTALVYGHKRTAQRVAAAMHRELANRLRSRPSLVGKQLLEFIRTFLEQLS